MDKIVPYKGPVTKHTNPDTFLGKLGDVMEDPNFRSFFDENFGTWDDCKAVLMVMKGYQVLRNTNKEASKEEILVTLEKMLKKRETRKQLCNTMNDFMKMK